jgi:hypothetical protein
VKAKDGRRQRSGSRQPKRRWPTRTPTGKIIFTPDQLRRIDRWCKKRLVHLHHRRDGVELQADRRLVIGEIIEARMKAKGI